MQRRRALGAVVVGLLWTAAGRVGATDAVGRLIEALTSARSFKVRVHAASLLARLKDPRSLPALMNAAIDDRHPAVRATAVRLLAKVAREEGGPTAQVRAVVDRALTDPEAVVRRQAAASRAELDRGAGPRMGGRAAAPGGALLVAVGTIGDRTRRAPRAARERMRALMMSLLQGEPRLRLAEISTPGVAFLVDGTIARLEIGEVGPNVEAVCAVELVVSRPPRGIVTVASGEAIVQRPRRQYQPVLADHMQDDALEHAVRSAHENLARFLAAQ